MLYKHAPNQTISLPFLRSIMGTSFLFTDYLEHFYLYGGEQNLRIALTSIAVTFTNSETHKYLFDHSQKIQLAKC